MIPPFLQEAVERYVQEDGFTFHRWYNHPMYGNVASISLGLRFFWLDFDPHFNLFLARERLAPVELVPNFTPEIKKQLKDYYNEYYKEKHKQQKIDIPAHHEDECPF